MKHFRFNVQLFFQKINYAAQAKKVTAIDCLLLEYKNDRQFLLGAFCEYFFGRPKKTIVPTILSQDPCPSTVVRDFPKVLLPELRS